MAYEPQIDRYFRSKSKELLNLTKDWLTSFLPHVLSKIHRVHYGLIQEDDIAKWRAEAVAAAGGDESAGDLHIPPSRQLLAVPFIGKDVPSPSSEFAHPEVIIGLTVLAYRHAGLRIGNTKMLVSHMKQKFLIENFNYKFHQFVSFFRYVIMSHNLVCTK